MKKKFTETKKFKRLAKEYLKNDKKLAKEREKLFRQVDTHNKIEYGEK